MKRIVPALIACVLPPVLLLAPARVDAQHHHGAQTRVPESMRHEHEHIHEQLEAATKASGAVGVAARELAAVLAPHFERENQIALPPLALLPALARGEPTGDVAAILAMSDSLRAELPRMLEEHGRIKVAAQKLEAVAREHAAVDVERLARTLQLHALTEEEVFYPAAIVVGDLLRAKQK